MEREERVDVKEEIDERRNWLMKNSDANNEKARMKEEKKWHEELQGKNGCKND